MTPGQMEAAATASAAGTSLRWAGTQAFQTYQQLAAYMEPFQGRPIKTVTEINIFFLEFTQLINPVSLKATNKLQMHLSGSSC